MTRALVHLRDSPIGIVAEAPYTEDIYITIPILLRLPVVHDLVVLQAPNGEAILYQIKAWDPEARALLCTRFQKGPEWTPKT